MRRTAVAPGLVLAACGQVDPGCPETAGIVCTLAGTGLAGLGEDGVDARASELYLPQDAAVGADGTPYIVDWNNHRIRVVEGGVVDTLVGIGIAGDQPDGPADQVAINHPTGVAVSPDGTLVIAVWHNSRLVEYDPVTETVRAAGGTGERGFAGDGGPVVSASFDLPVAVAFAADGRMFVADQNNLRIRVVDADGIVSTHAGTGSAGDVDGPGSSASFDWPRGDSPPPGGRIDADASGALFVADSSNNVVRRVDPAGLVSTFAGDGRPTFAGDGGPALAASFSRPSDVALSQDGTLYVADTDNSCVRAIDRAGTVETVAGVCGTAGRGEDGELATASLLDRPYGIAVGPGGELYVADTHNQRVVVVRTR